MAKHSYDEYISAFREGTSGGTSGRNSTAGTAAGRRSYNDYVSAFRAGAGIGYKSKQEAAVQPELKPQEVKLESQIQGIRQQSQRIEPKGGQNQTQDIQTIRSKVQKLPQRQTQNVQPADNQTGSNETANAYDETGIRADTQAYKNPKTLSAMAANGDAKASELMRRRYQSLEKEYGNADSGRAQRESREKRMRELDAQLAVVQQNIQNVTRTVTGPLPDTEEGRKTANQLRAWNMQRDRLLEEKQALSQQEDVKTGVYAAQEKADSAMKSYKKAAMEYQSSRTTVKNIANGLVNMYKGSSLYDALVEAQKQDEDEAEKNGTTPTYDRLFKLLEQDGMTPEYIDRISGQWASMPYSQALSEAQEREKALSAQEKTLRTSAQRESDAWEYEVARAYSDKDFAELSKPLKEKMPDGALGEAYNVLMQSKDSILKQGADFFDTEVEIGGKTLTWQELTEMSDEERKLFFYYCNTGNEDIAALWLSSNADALKYRRGETIADLADYPVLREIAALGSSAVRGAELVGYGIGSVFADIDAPDVTSDEYALASLSRRNKGTVAGFTIGAAQNIGNMAPSLAGYAVNPALGVSATFLNARGNAYVEAKREGFTHGQAWIYSTLVGASEAGLEKVLGGMGGIAKGAVPEKVLNMFGEPKKLVWKLVRDYGVHASSELIEENLQNYLEPAFKMIAGMEDQYDAPGAEEFIETSVVTAITTLFFSAAQAPAKVRQEKINQAAGRWADAAIQLGEGKPAYTEGVKLRELLDSGENISQEQLLGAFERIGDLDEILKTQAQQVQQQTQERAAQVQEQNPDATVIKSSGTQAYIDKGAKLEDAQQAGEVLDKIVSGELTSVKITSKQIDLLRPATQYGRDAIKEVLGVEVKTASSAAARRAAVRETIARYEKQMADAAREAAAKSAVATAGISPVQIVPADGVQTDAQSYAPTEARTTAPAIASAADGVSSARVVPAQNGGVATVSQNPAQAQTLMTYKEFKRRVASDKEFRKRYIPENKKLSEEERTTIAYENYRAESAAGIAHRSVKDTQFGVERNEYSAKVDERTVSAVDALAKLFRIKVRFSDLGGDNGLYHADTGEIELDIAPYHSGAKDAFLFTAAHEIGHAVKARLSAAAWNEFSQYAIAAKGGESAVKEKQESSEVYAEASVAREEVVCDFIGELLSEQETLNTFCESIRNGKVKAETAHGIVAEWRKITNLLRGKGANQTDAATAALVQRVQEQFNTDIETAENAVRKMQKALSAAMKQNYNITDDYGNTVDYKYSKKVQDKKTLDFLNNQEYVTTYKTMQIIDGKLYPPMAAVVAGSAEDHSVLGQWEAATEHPELIKVDKNGKHKFTLNKGKGQGSIDAAYNPYMHSSNLVINDQFSGAYARENLVTVECHVPKSELTSGYHAEYAKDSVGWHSWHTGTVASAIRSEKGIERKVLLSRWIKPVRIIPDSEVASMYQELLSGTNIAVPDNVVSPSLLSELKKIGVNIKESGKVTKNAADTGDVMFSKKNNTKRSATSPLSGSPATQGSFSVASKPVTAAADHLGIDVSLSQLSDSVKGAISAFSEIVDAIDKQLPAFGGKHTVSAGNLEGALIKAGILSRRGSGDSAYRTDGDHTLRISGHSARADNFATSGENLSIVLLKTNKTNDFSANETNNVVEVHFKKDYLDRNPEAFKNLVKDMARFVATGEYHDTAGAKNYNISGTEQFRTEMAQRLAEDERARSAVAKDTVKRSRKDVPATNMDSDGRRLSEGQRAYFQNSVVRDDAGNLLVVYHGTDAEFTVFDILKAGKNGRAEGYGFYFSDDQEITRKYGDRQMEVYLNITKPLYSDRRTLTKAELRRFAEAVVSDEMLTYDMDWRDSFISNYIDTYSGRISRTEAVTRFVNQIWETNDNDQDLIYEIANGSGQNYSVESMKRFYATLKDSIGVDGNISTWHHADGTSKVYVAFSPEQAKNVDNANPTKDTDIRRSRKDTPRRVIPTPEQAQALEEKRKAREAEQEAERIRRRDEFMRNFVRSAPGVAPHLQRSAIDTDIRRSRKEQRIEDLVAKHGAIPTGENPVRDVSVPNRTTEDTRVRRTVRTAMEAQATPEALIPRIEDSIIEGSFNYKPKKNAETMEAAHEWVERRKTVDDAYKDWLSAKKNHLNADMIARGFIIYNNYANAAETVKSEAERVKLQQNAVSILQDISVMGTVAGQTAQAMRLLKQQTPESQYYALERAVQKLQDGINDRYGGKKADAPKIEIDKKLAGKWLQALREGDMELAYDLEAVLFQNIASQIPKTLGDRMNAWRYLSMLGNPKTLIRNAVGNAAFTPVVMAKDKIGAAMELFLEKDKRTKYLGLLHASEEGRALLKFASEDGQSADVLQLMERNKYDDTSLNDRLARYVQEKKRTFTAPVLKQWQAATRYMMEKAPFMGDEFYKSVHYRRAFAGAAMARGYTVSDLTSGKVSETKLMELRVYAANQAMKATFNDTNKVSDLVSRARFKNNGLNTALEGTLPFKRTPANVAVRSFEYSPAGLLKALSTDIYALKTGKITGQEYIERLSQGVTGSVMFGLGWLAAALGIVRVNVDDDDEREGRQSYSLEVFGKSVTLDWLAPTSVAFFMGSETQELLSGWGEDQSFLDAMLDSTSNLFAPVLEMTALSGAKDLLDTFVYSYKKDGADVGQITMALFVQPFLSYLGQYAPTIFGQGENLFEPYRTTTYVGDINGKVERVFVRNFAKILEKVPFVDWRQIEYVDEWGRKDYNGDIPLRFFNSFINPAYVNDIVPTEVDAEVRRIKETTGKNVSPTKRGYKITVSEYDEDGEKLGSREVVLSAEQYRDYQMEYGTQYALMASALMASEYYDTLSDSEKAKAFKEIESLADEYGKLAANVGYMIDPGSTDNKLYELVQMGMPAAEAYSARLMYTQINNDDEMKPVERYEQFRVWVYGNDAWTEEEKQAVIDLFGKFSSGFVAGSENFDEMLRLGVDADKALSINDGIRNLKPEDGLVNVSPSQKYGYILSRSDLSIAEKNAAIKSYMSSNETAAFAPCEAAGITATEYAEVVLKIGDLEPIGENKGVTAAQKYEVCVKSFSSEEKQDAMLRRYMSAETEAKYDTLRDSGVSPATYVAWYSAKYTYGDGNGSWKQDELEKWLRENVSSRAQRAALWEATNAGWKNNPFK